MDPLPKNKIRRPKSLRDVDNGQVPETLLVECGLGPGYLLLEPAAQAFIALVAHFKSTHEIFLSATGCYRSYRQQVALFKERYSDQPLPGRPTKSFNGITYWLKPGVAQAAQPGFSNHGWGLAVDVCVQKPKRKVGLDKNTIRLLVADAPSFGWCWELDREPWHLVYFQGTTK